MTETTEMTDRYAQTKDVEVNKVPDGYVIYHAAKDRVHFLNMTAAVIFELCDGAHSLSEIEAILVEVYELTDFPRSAFLTCVDNLIKEGLIVPCRS
jgi:hypothetical protein